uniref:G_PROTEIN_RECEP_F1_2 domain-containing protein n=1 Tax=Rhabditophanes sp. KR3021 TaxID=114890 RepID=A0AC35UEW8_9BILA
MVQLVLDPKFIQKNYPCDFLTQAEWKAYGNPNLFLGIAYILIGLVCILLYIPVIIILMRKDLLENSCYKLILFLTFVDVLALIPCSLITGWLTIDGQVYCSSPTFILYSGTIGMCGWNISCFVCLVLAFNRCLDICLPKVWELLFAGKKTLLWIVASILYGVKMSFFAPGLFYSSRGGAWFYTPYYLITVKEFSKDVEYMNWGEVVHNIIIVVGLSTMYTIFIGTLFCKLKTCKNKFKLSSSQKSLLIQTTFICSASMSCAGLYMVTNWIIVNKTVIIASQIAWILSHGCSSFSLAFCNKTIRTHIYQDLFPNRLKKYFYSKAGLPKGNTIKIAAQNNIYKRSECVCLRGDKSFAANSSLASIKAFLTDFDLSKVFDSILPDLIQHVLFPKLIIKTFGPN